jgi:hypothetical protein
MTPKTPGLIDQKILNPKIEEGLFGVLKKMKSKIKPSSSGPSEPEDPESANLIGRAKGYLDRGVEVIGISKLKRLNGFGDIIEIIQSKIIKLKAKDN